MAATAPSWPLTTDESESDGRISSNASWYRSGSTKTMFTCWWAAEMESYPEYRYLTSPSAAFSTVQPTVSNRTFPTGTTLDCTDRLVPQDMASSTSSSRP